MMSQQTSIDEDLIFLILQFLDDHKFSETARMLEQESNLFFNIKYFEEQVLGGKWEEAEGYLSRFTNLKDNRYSKKIFFDLRKQKYLEALDNFDRVRALNILTKELKEFFSVDDDVFKDLTLLLSLDNFRDNELLSCYKDAKSARTDLMTELKRLIAANCLLCEKLQFPSIPTSRLLHLINQSLDWQHKLCSNCEPSPVMRTLFEDHDCQQSNDQCSQQVTSNELIGSALGAEGCLPFGTNLSSQCASVPVPSTCTVVDHSPHTEKMHLSALAKRAASLSDSRDKIPRKKSRKSSNKVGQDVNVRNVRFNSIEDTESKSKIWKLTEISEPAQLQSLQLPLSMEIDKILRLIYTSSGSAILALSSNAINLQWQWLQDDLKVKIKATTKVPPLIKQVKSGLMTNDLTEAKSEEAVPCLALANNESYLLSASGGKVSLFNLMNFKTIITFMPPAPAATCLAFHPQNNNIFIVGMDDSTIQIYDFGTFEVTSKLKGHSRRVTGLSFSHELSSLVSSGADAQIIVWSMDTWEMLKNTFLQISADRMPAAPSNTHVQFHQDQIHFLAVNRTQLAIYEAKKLECVKQWVVGDSLSPIAHAAFSSDSQSVYTGFLDGTVFIFHASSLQVQCRINPAAYMPSGISSTAYPLVIAPNPQQPNQFALGLSEGGVLVLEPLEPEGQWGVPPPAEDNSPSSVSSSSAAVGSSSDQDQSSLTKKFK